MTINNNEQTIVCAYCGEPITGDHVTTSDGRTFCLGCANEHLAFCECCEAYYLPWEVHRVHVYHDGLRHHERWCEHCIEENADYCDECGSPVARGTFGSILTDVRGGDSVCPRCLEIAFRECCECGEFVRVEHYNEDEDACCDCHPRRPPLIVGYHGADAAFPRFVTDGEPCTDAEFAGIGLEVEIDRRDEDEDEERACAEELHELLGERAVFEHDGSLNYGFEIVTRPHTLRAFREHFPLDEMLSVCKSHGYLAHDIGTCGLHMHISRRYFGKAPATQERAIGKCLAFYDVFYGDMVKASRRNIDRAMRWANRVPVDGMKDARQKAKGGDYDVGRYAAVNTTNRHTVEFRLMRGTLNPDTLRACLDLMLAIARNAKRLNWETATSNAAEMLHGITPATLAYLRRRDAFLPWLDAVHVSNAPVEEVVK